MPVAKVISIAVAVVFILLGVCPSSRAASGDEAAAAEKKQGITGELEYRWYCAQCHGMSATGNGPVAPALKKKPANLRLLSKNNGGVFPREDVRDFIDGRKGASAHGSREMPIWGTALRGNQPGVYIPGKPLTEQEAQRRIELLVDYLSSIQAK
jgi:mono/diheme cytochrome c family protein